MDKNHSDHHPHNCNGCQNFNEYDGETACLKQIRWVHGVPPKPYCFDYSPDFIAAAKDIEHRVEVPLASPVPALKSLIEHAPPHILAMIHADAFALWLTPPKTGETTDVRKVLAAVEVGEERTVAELLAMKLDSHLYELADLGNESLQTIFPYAFGTTD